MRHSVTVFLSSGKRVDVKSRVSYDDETHTVTIRTGRLFWAENRNYEVDPNHVSFDAKGKMTIPLDINTRKSFSLDMHTEPNATREAMADYLSDKSFWARALAVVAHKRDWWEIVFVLLAGIGVYSIFRVVVFMLGYVMP